MEDKILKTEIKWIDKERIVLGHKIRFQKMYNCEVAVFERKDLIGLIKEVKKK